MRVDFKGNRSNRRALWLVKTAVLLFLTTSSYGQMLRYTIKGSVPAQLSQVSIVYLVDLSNNNAIDSSAVTGEQFLFSGKVLRPACYRIDLSRGGREESAILLSRAIVLEEGEIIVDFRSSNFYGTPLNRELSNYYAQFKEIEKSNIDGDDALQVELEERLERLSMRYFKENSDNPVGVFIMRNHIGLPFGASLDFFGELYREANQYIREFPTIKSIYSRLERVDGSRVGAHYLDFTLSNGTSDGSETSLSNYIEEGKYTLLFFWATWASSSSEPLSQLIELYENYKERDINILGVSVWDSREEGIKWLRERERELDKEIEWPTIFDENGISAELYGIEFFPHFIVIDRDGVIIQRGEKNNFAKEKNSSAKLNSLE